MPLAIALEGFVPRNRSAKPAYGRRRWLGQAGVLAVGTAFFALAQARIRMSNTLAAITQVTGYFTTGERIANIRFRPVFPGWGNGVRSFLEAA
jgi:hypothetical protein